VDAGVGLTTVPTVATQTCSRLPARKRLTPRLRRIVHLLVVHLGYVLSDVRGTQLQLRVGSSELKTEIAENDPPLVGSLWEPLLQLQQ